MCCSFQRTGSCSVCVRALRQWRCRLSWLAAERVPASSKIALAVSTETRSAKALAVATAIDARAEQRLRGAHADRQLADALDQQGIVAGALDLRLEPRSARGAHELAPVLE